MLKRQEQENDTAFHEARLAYDTEVKKLLNSDDPNSPGLFQMRGKAALDSATEVSHKIRKLKSNIIAKYGDSPVGRRLKVSLGDRESVYADRISSYVSRQRFFYDGLVSDARKTEYLDDAATSYNDDKALAQIIANMDLLIERDAARQGFDDEVMASKKQEAHTTLHGTVIDRYLASEDVAGAQAYFKRVRKDIDGRDHAKFVASIELARKRAESAISDEVKEAIAILDMGKAPAGLTELRDRVKGTRFAPGLNEAVNDLKVVEDFVRLSVADQQERLKSFQTQDTFTADEARRFSRMAKAHARIVERLDNGDGLALAQELGVIGNPVELSFGNPETLKERRRQAEIASEHFGVNVGPLSAGEVSVIAGRLDSANANQVAALLASLHSGFGDMASEIAAELTKGKRPEYAQAMLLAGEGRASMQSAIDIILGGREKREVGTALEITPAQRRDAIKSVFGNMFEGIEGTPIREFTAAADALYATRRIPTGDLTYDEDAYEQALKDAMGGVVEFNGRKVIPPRPGISEDDFTSFVRSLSDADLVTYSVSGGAPVIGDEPFSASMFTRQGVLDFGADAQLVSVGPGIYRVLVKGIGFVQDDATGKAYEIDLRLSFDTKGGS